MRSVVERAGEDSLQAIENGCERTIDLFDACLDFTLDVSEAILADAGDISIEQMTTAI